MWAKVRCPQQRQRVAHRLRHRTRQSGSGGEGPEAMEEVEVVILRFSLAACNPGCLHLVLESMAPKAPYLLKNRTAHPFQYRQAGLGDLPFQPLPAYSAAGFAWQVTKKSYPREVEVQEAYGKQSPQRYPLDPPDPKSVSGEDASTHDRGMGGPLAWLPLSVQPGEVLVQDVDREQELTSTAGLQSRGGGAELSLDRELRIVPSRKGPIGELAVLGLASATTNWRPAVSLQMYFQWARPTNPLISFQISNFLQISLSETLEWRAAEMVQRLDLTSLTAPEDEEHTEATTDVPMQMSLVSISSLAAKVSFRGDLAARPRENSTMLWSVCIYEVGQNIKGRLVGVALSFLCYFGTLSGAIGVLGALSSGVASAALDDRFAVQRAQQKQERSIEGVGDGMVEGRAALGMGIYRGFTGLVTNPVEGAKSKGVGGFFKGVGKGVADGKVTVFLDSDATEKEAQVEEVGQALLRKTQDAGGVGPRRKGKHSRFHMDAYKKHMLLPDDQVVTNQCIMKLRARGFAQVHRAAESGASSSASWRSPLQKCAGPSPGRRTRFT
ncbi:hypothetical protein WJX79_007540 [Trebouxia sp. C0005]